MKFVVKVQPTGCINGREWPAVGEEIDLPEHVGDGMPEIVMRAQKIETRPAKRAVETRKG